MSKSATTAWNDLYYWRLDPETWAKKIDQAMKYFSYTVAQKYPEFRWCHGNWKVQEFATQRYPGWNRYNRQSGQLKRRIPSIVKRKVEDDNDSAPKMKKRRRKQAPPPDHDIIDLDSEIDVSALQSSSSDSGPATVALASARSAPSFVQEPQVFANPVITSSTSTGKSRVNTQLTGSPGPSPVATTAATSTLSSSFTPTTMTSSNPGLDMATESVQSISSPAQSPSLSTVTASESDPATVTVTANMLLTCSPGPSPLAATAPAPSSVPPSLVLATPITTESSSESSPGPAIATANINASTLEAASTTASGSGNMAPLVSESVTPEATATTSTVLGEKGAQATRSSRRALVDPLAGLLIPAPPNEVPQTNIQPTETLPIARVPAKPKKSKVLEPSKTLVTARNLYAIFYKKTHPDVTEAEFREIYKGLDKETVKKYEAQSKQMKAAAGKTATAAAQGISGDA